MYFWRIDQLKMQMAYRPLADREILPYLVLFVAISAGVSSLPGDASMNVWDGSIAALSVLLAVVGTIYIYRQNGAADGKHFLQRYFAVGWVVSIRWVAAFSIAFTVWFAALEAMAVSQDTTAWHDVLFFAVAEILLYWRIGHHVRDLARQAATATA